MGKNKPSRPEYTSSVGAMIRQGASLIAYCPTCRGWKSDVDMQAIVAAKGEDYDLWGRTTRCTFTPECKGRVGFRYKYGMMDCGMRD